MIISQLNFRNQQPTQLFSLAVTPRMHTKGSLVICADTKIKPKLSNDIIEMSLDRSKYHFWNSNGVGIVLGVFSRLFLKVKIFAHDFEHLQ